MEFLRIEGKEREGYFYHLILDDTVHILYCRPNSNNFFFYQSLFLNLRSRSKLSSSSYWSSRVRVERKLVIDIEGASVLYEVLL